MEFEPKFMRRYGPALLDELRLARHGYLKQLANPNYGFVHTGDAGANAKIMSQVAQLHLCIQAVTAEMEDSRAAIEEEEQEEEADEAGV